MRRRFGRYLATAVSIVALVALFSCQRHELLLPGDVKDLDGKPIEGCRVELLVKGQLFSGWTSYIAREAVTDSTGQFSFDVIAIRAATYRLRIAHPGYQEWLHEAPWPRTPRRYHIALLREGQSMPVAPAGRD